MLPTHVGMDRVFRFAYETEFNAPHARGDGPQFDIAELVDGLCSPRTWGWTGAAWALLNGSKMLPTHVGMDRRRSSRRGPSAHAPHARGDGPAF